MSGDNPESYNEVEQLIDAVTDFSDAMENRLVEKHAEGYRGWDSAEEVCEDLPDGTKRLSGIDNFVNGLFHSATKAEWVDVANWAMFLWNLELMQKEADDER